MDADPHGEDWLIVGNGAIGMSLAHRLHLNGVAVALCPHGNRPDPVELVYEVLGHPPVRWKCPVRVRPDSTPVRRIVITTKAPAVREVLRVWSPALAQDARVIYVQNGTDFVRPGDLPACVTELFVVNGGFTAYRKGPDHVVQSAMEPIWIGDESGSEVSGSEVVEADLHTLREAGFRVRWTADIVRLRWEKISINAIVNAEAVLHDCVNGELLACDGAARDVRVMCDELGPLFAAMGIAITADRLHEATLALLEATGGNVCSTLQDYRRGSTVHELDHINLALLREARSRAIEMPVMERVYRRVTELFRANRPT